MRTACPTLDDVCGWNELARGIVANTRTNPPMASRVYAYLSVAIDEVLTEAPSDLGTVSTSILAALLPGIEPHRPCERSARAIVRRLIERMKSDRADAVWQGTIPQGPGSWSGTNPLLPLWGEVEPWCLDRGSQFRAPLHAPFGSPAFDEALAEVRRISDARTPEQLRIARFWADGSGTSTPAGHWNAIACDILKRTTRDARRAAHVLRCLNIAMADAAICCWDNKYAHWLLRPSQANHAITTPVGLPNFPSFTSGHATFSGAAARVLGALIPAAATEVEAMAQEAALSRLYGGIHYRFDNETGLEGGRLVADVALACCERSCMSCGSCDCCSCGGSC